MAQHPLSTSPNTTSYAQMADAKSWTLALSAPFHTSSTLTSSVVKSISGLASSAMLLIMTTKLGVDDYIAEWIAQHLSKWLQHQNFLMRNMSRCHNNPTMPINTFRTIRLLFASLLRAFLRANPGRVLRRHSRSRCLGLLRFGLLVGIGGEVPTKETDIRLGDVAVSRPNNLEDRCNMTEERDRRFIRTGLSNTHRQYCLWLFPSWI